MIVVLLLQKEQKHLLITAPKVHSYYYSDKTETIPIHVLTTLPDHYYYDMQYMSNCAIYSDQQTIAFDMYDVRVNETNYNHMDLVFQQVSFYLKPQVILTNTVIKMEEAQVVITYQNGQELTFSIGEFNYVFDASFNDDLALGHLSATVHSNLGFPTVSGLNLLLTNNTTSNITIRNIELVSSSVIANTRQLIKRTPCDKHTAVKDCLGVTHYNPNTLPEMDELSYTMTKDQSIELYVPLSFISYRHAERFSVRIIYEHHGQERIYYIDDFPFIQTLPFQDGYKEEYITYELD
jgi:hypothetical protein